MRGREKVLNSLAEQVRITRRTKKEKERANREKAASWLELMVSKIGIAFHPDIDFNDYITRLGGSRLYTEKHAKLLNERMERTLGFLGDKAYDIAVRAMEKLIPQTKKGNETMKKTTTKKATKKATATKKEQSKKKANNAKGNGKSIRQSIMDLMRDRGVDNVTNEQCEKIAKKIKSDTAWQKTHFYYYRKIVKAEETTRRSTPKRKKAKAKK